MILELELWFESYCIFEKLKLESNDFPKILLLVALLVRSLNKSRAGLANSTFFNSLLILIELLIYDTVLLYGIIILPLFELALVV